MCRRARVPVACAPLPTRRSRHPAAVEPTDDDAHRVLGDAATTVECSVLAPGRMHARHRPTQCRRSRHSSDPPGDQSPTAGRPSQQPDASQGRRSPRVRPGATAGRTRRGRATCRPDRPVATRIEPDRVDDGIASATPVTHVHRIGARRWHRVRGHRRQHDQRSARSPRPSPVIAYRRPSSRAAPSRSPAATSSRMRPLDTRAPSISRVSISTSCQPSLLGESSDRVDGPLPVTSERRLRRHHQPGQVTSAAQSVQELLGGLRPECLVEPLHDDQLGARLAHAHQLLVRIADELGDPARDDRLRVRLEGHGDRHGTAARRPAATAPRARGRGPGGRHRTRPPWPRTGGRPGGRRCRPATGPCSGGRGRHGGGRRARGTPSRGGGDRYRGGPWRPAVHRRTGPAPGPTVPVPAPRRPGTRTTWPRARPVRPSASTCTTGYASSPESGGSSSSATRPEDRRSRTSSRGCDASRRKGPLAVRTSAPR